MEEIDVVEKIVTTEPEIPVYVPYAGYTVPGIASFDSDDFHVDNFGNVKFSDEIDKIRDDAQDAADAAAASASSANTSAQSASNNALLAEQYKNEAKEYAKKEYIVVDSFADLPNPGDSAFIYLVPSSGGASNDSYSEYLWISEDNKYEYIGSVNDVDLSNYAQINGNYQGMTVGAATKATQDGDGNVITDTYATKTEVGAKYTKPADGIPESDLASAVQTSLGKANTALQSVPLATSSAVGGVKPVAKTDDMTQSVGVDASGALFTAPSGGTIEYMTNDEVDALFN